MDTQEYRKAINYNYRAQQKFVKEKNLRGLKLNSSKPTFDNFFLDKITSYVDFIGYLTHAMADSHYETALWSSTDDDGNPLDNGNYELSDSAKACLDYDLTEFIIALEKHNITLELIEELTGQDESHVAHDFWLTRNHHGAGFWDGDYGVLGDKLTEIAQTFNTCDLWVGKDNLVYVY
jgi:hypothetical protein